MDRVESIFILGGSQLQLPAIQQAKERGMKVFVLDYDSNAVGKKYADIFLEISTIDVEAVYKAAKKYHPDYIITSTSDMPVRTVAWVDEKLGRKSGISYENSLCATDKALMRHRMQERGVPIPAFFVIHSYDEFEQKALEMGNAFVVKPADNAASRGVYLVKKSKKNEYHRIYEYSKKYARNGIVLIEEYMEGPEVSVEVYVVDSVPHIITITDKYVTEVPFFVELGHSEPSQLPLRVQEKIKEVAYEAARALEIVNGPAHVEIKVTPDGVKLVEIAARLGGDYITSQLVPLSTGIDMIGITFDLLQGKKIAFRRGEECGSAIRFLVGQEGVIKEIEGIDEAYFVQGIQEIVLYKNSGDKISSPHNSGDRVGHVISIGCNAEEAVKNAERALKKIHIIYE